MAIVRSTVVELCVFKRTRKGPRYLVLKRASTEKLYPDLWQIITGKIKPKEMALHAGMRELKEETGFTTEHVWVVPFVDSFFDPRSDAIELCPLFVAEVATDAEPILSSEHQGYEWADVNRAEKLLVWPGHHQALRTVHDYIVTNHEAARLTVAVPNDQKG